MAMQDDLFALVRQFIRPIHDLPQRFQFRAFDLRPPVFRRLAHVNQAELLAGIHPAFQLFDSHHSVLRHTFHYYPVDSSRIRSITAVSRSTSGLASAIERLLAM